MRSPACRPSRSFFLSLLFPQIPLRRRIDRDGLHAGDRACSASWTRVKTPPPWPNCSAPVTVTSNPGWPQSTSRSTAGWSGAGRARPRPARPADLRPHRRRGRGRPPDRPARRGLLRDDRAARVAQAGRTAGTGGLPGRLATGVRPRTDARRARRRHPRGCHGRDLDRRHSSQPHSRDTSRGTTFAVLTARGFRLVAFLPGGKGTASASGPRVPLSTQTAAGQRTTQQRCKPLLIRAGSVPGL